MMYSSDAPPLRLHARGMFNSVHRDSKVADLVERTPFYLVADEWTHYAKHPRVNYYQTKWPSR